jgi:PIN domain nuclease of toxin-antitoxin system
MIDEVDHLSDTARKALEDGSNELVLHQASSWEIQIKYQTGKLKLRDSPEELIAQGLERHKVEYARLEDIEIWHLQKLPAHHRDPFDRLLIASALCQGMRLVTPDPQIHKYPVPIVW